MGSDLVVVVVGDKIRTDLGVIGQWWRRMFMSAIVHEDSFSLKVVPLFNGAFSKYYN